MRKFLCLKDLVMKTDGRIELTAGKLYRETKPIGDRDNAVINNSGKTHNNVQRWGVFVETFERDGVEWIEHDGGDCPVPGDWRVEFSHESGGHVFGRGGLLARLFCWGPIVAYRIISTGEQERQFKSEEHREMVEDAEESTEQDKIQQAIQTLRDLTQIQCSDGNWNYDEYMHGMANGMLFALSLFESGEPKYLDAPDVWLRDKGKTDQKIGAGSGGKTLPINADIDYHPHMLGGKFGGVER